ncbi:MAG: hypothetical protein LBC98_04750 [Prevotellaceae bacterium]|jgi:tetratricopeptide (TPR) repeat protein|nr:hypothetical protein [Prevotellaceae bacterium]
MKDIVDRNCDAQEEEINTQIPMPIYFGLMGTMLGIITGIISLIASGGLTKLFTGAAAADSVEGLLGGVGVAMITSIIGIFLNVIASSRFKDARARTEKNKNTFLSWMQAELLPQLSGDVSGALVKMSSNLSVFNETFAENTRAFGSTLQEVKDINDSQAELYRLINTIRIHDIASANIEVYEKLKNCADEIGVLGNYLEGIRAYITDMQNTIHTIQQYFQSEREQINRRSDVFNRQMEAMSTSGASAMEACFEALNRKLEEISTSSTIALQTCFDAFNRQWETMSTSGTSILQACFDTFNRKLEEISNVMVNKLPETFDKANLTVSGKLEQFEEDFSKSLQRLQENLDRQALNMPEKLTEAFEKSLQHLQQALTIPDELLQALRSLIPITQSMAGFEKAIAEQNRKIDRLTDAIIELANVKTGGNMKMLIPRWLKITFGATGGIVIVFCLFSMIIKLLTI